MKDISGSSIFRVTRPIEKSWSDSKKYYVETAAGEKLFLRISGISGFERIKKKFDMMREVAKLGVPIPIFIEYGLCSGGGSVYSLFTWIDGDEADGVLLKMTPEELYMIGVKAGQMLAKIHALPTPGDQEDWKKRFEEKQS